MSFIDAGDFNPTSNGFQIKSITNPCQFKLVKNLTRGTNILDLIIYKHFAGNPCSHHNFGSFNFIVRISIFEKSKERGREK